jgi:hypothetical protein
MLGKKGERRKSVQEKLEQVVDQTQRLSSAAAAALSENPDDGEFQEGDDRDELGTLLEAEREEQEGEVAEEVDELHKEAEMDIESLLAQYGGYKVGGTGSEEEEEEEEEVEEEVEEEQQANHVPVSLEKKMNDEYQEEQDEDEMGTLLEAEQQEDKGEVAKEVNELQKEADMDIESLLAQYGGYKMGGGGSDEEEEDVDDVDEDNEVEEQQLASKKRVPSPAAAVTVASVAGPSKRHKAGEEEGEYQEEQDEDELGTLLEAEREELEGEVAEEVDELQKEAEMDIESLLAQYGGYKVGGTGSEEEEEEEEEDEEIEEEADVMENGNEDVVNMNEDDDDEEESLREGEVAPFGTAQLLEGGQDAGRAVMESAARVVRREKGKHVVCGLF